MWGLNFSIRPSPVLYCQSTFELVVTCPAHVQIKSLTFNSASQLAESLHEHDVSRSDGDLA